MYATTNGFRLGPEKFYAVIEKLIIANLPDIYLNLEQFRYKFV